MTSLSKSKNVMILLTITLVIVYCLATVTSIVLLGDRSLISGDLFRLDVIFSLLTNWKFIVSMSSAVVARLTFVLINSTLLKIPDVAHVATTITVFVTLLSLIFIVVANHFFLDEKLDIQQIIGALVILVGVFIMLR